VSQRLRHLRKCQGVEVKPLSQKLAEAGGDEEKFMRAYLEHYRTLKKYFDPVER